MKLLVIVILAKGSVDIQFRASSNEDFECCLQRLLRIVSVPASLHSSNASTATSINVFADRCNGAANKLLKCVCITAAQVTRVPLYRIIDCDG